MTKVEEISYKVHMIETIENILPSEVNLKVIIIQESPTENRTTIDMDGVQNLLQIPSKNTWSCI